MKMCLLRTNFEFKECVFAKNIMNMQKKHSKVNVDKR